MLSALFRHLAVTFIVYINDLCNLNIDGSIITYADDTVLLFKGDSWCDVFVNANESLKRVYSWLNSNLLTLNKSKTIFITHTVNKKTQPKLDMVLKWHNPNCNIDSPCDCSEFQPTDTTKYLGIIMDKFLK
jgi:Reverse transcriptase (RNA-dependent DNA polymerase)